MAINNLASQFTDGDISFIQHVMNEVLHNRGGGPMSGIEVYESTKGCLSRDFPENTFRTALSAAIRCGKITGIVGKRGKGAGYFLVDSVPESKRDVPVQKKNTLYSIAKDEMINSVILEKVKSNQEIANINSKNTIIISNRKVSVPLSLTKIRTLLFQVLSAKEDADGEVKFDNKTFICDYDLLNKFIFNFFGSSYESKDDCENIDDEDDTSEEMMASY